jgi:hypothetical protein
MGRADGEETMAEDEDELSLACQKVGLFLHKFALLEQEINERIVDMLELKGLAADVIAHSVDFFKKLNLLHTVAVGQTPPKEKQRVKKIFDDIAKQNNDNRVVVAHSRFEPALKGSVQFRRTVARDGKVEVQDQKNLWTVAKFTEEFKKLDELRTKLNELKPRLTWVGASMSFAANNDLERGTGLMGDSGMPFAAQGVQNGSGSRGAGTTASAAGQKK